VVKAELKRLRSIKAESEKKKKRIEKEAVAQARIAIVNQPELTHEAEQPAGVAVEAAANKPHVTHDMRTFTTAAAVIIFCDRCGKWQ
jgi:hypothetical protein